MPYSITAVDRMPMRKNFRPASLERGSRLRNAAISHPGAVTSSSEMNSIRRSRDEEMVSIPRNEDSNRK
jgi:hypothetical protein